MKCSCGCEFEPVVQYRHRLLCGDSTKKEDVERVMGGEKADMVFTDPPYGINLDTDYSGISGGWSGQIPFTKSKKYDSVIGDDKPFDPSHLFRFFDLPEMFLWGADYYADKIPSCGSWIVWDKTGNHCQEVVGSEFELLWSKKKHRRIILSVKWAGVIGLSNQKTGGRVHPTQKPIEIFVPIIKEYSKENDIVIDTYLGSGTTMVSAENLKRRCFGIEISPAYCAVILERMSTAFPVLEIKRL